MGKFDDAVTCCKRHLEISRELGDRLSEGRALYNLGNVYHAQGKQLGRVGQNDPGQFPQEVRDCLNQALSYYESVPDKLINIIKAKVFCVYRYNITFSFQTKFDSDD